MTSSKPIAKQITGISSTLIVGLVVLSLCAISATAMIRSTFLDYREASRATLAASTVFTNVLEARIAALKWRFSSDASQIEDFRRNISALDAAGATLEGIDLDASTLGDPSADLKADIATYETQFDAMLQARERFDALEEQIGSSATDARKALTEIMSAGFRDRDIDVAYRAGRAQEALMLGRYYFQRYRRSEDASDLERWAQEMDSFQVEMRLLLPEIQNPQQRGIATDALAEIEALTAAKDELVAEQQAQVAARDILDTLGPRIVANIEPVIATATDRQNMLGPRGQAITFWAVVMICLVALPAISIGWLVARRMSARISREMESSVETMTRIADGDLDAEVKNTDYENEIGRMARALEVFKANGRAAIEAAEREKAAEERRLAAIAAQKEENDAREAAARAEAEAARKAMIADLSKSLGEVVSAASAGDFSRRVNDDFGDEELKALARDVNAFVDNVEFGLNAAGQALSRVADGDLTSNMEGDFQGAFKELQDNTNRMISALKELVLEITESGSNLSSSSEELRDTSASLSKQAEQNAAALEETSAALEELTASIKQVSENVSDANQNAREASDAAQSSSEVAAAAAEAMARISTASSEITRVVAVIDDISFQINLLALNAGVEASRAGDAGRGFSVVASEVRSLAQRASDAAKEISHVIGQSEIAVSEGVEKVSNAQLSLKKISDSVVGVSKRIDEVSGAISEQVHGVGEINTAIARIDQNTQKQAASFEEVTAASGLLSGEAEGLKRSIMRFETGREATRFVSVRERPMPERSTTREARPRTDGNLAIDDQDWEDF